MKHSGGVTVCHAETECVVKQIPVLIVPCELTARKAPLLHFSSHVVIKVFRGNETGERETGAA